MVLAVVAQQTQQASTSVWEAGTAVATLAAVLATLYVSVWQERRRRPRLTLRLSDEARTGVAFHEESGTSNVATLVVHNANGKRTAEDVQVLLTVWRPGSRPIMRLVNQRRLQWWYGGDRLGGEGATTTETLGPGVSRPVTLALIGHPKVIHDALGWQLAWNVMDDETRDFWREHRHGIWAIAPLDPEGGGWLSVESTLNIAVTITARDVDAQTFYSSVTLRVRDLGAEHHHFKVLAPTFAVFSTSPLGNERLSISDAEQCSSPEGCSARNWPWADQCWRCGWGLLG